MCPVANPSRTSKVSLFKGVDPKLRRQLLLRVLPLVAVFAFLLVPSCFRYQGARTQLNDIRTQTEYARSTIAQAANLQKNRGLYLDAIQRMETRFFSEDEIPQLLPLISELARQEDLRTLSTKPKEKTPADLYGQTPPSGPMGAPPSGYGPNMGQPQGMGPGTGAPMGPGMMPGQRPPATKPEFYKEAVFEIGVQGGYHSLGSWLTKIRRHPKFMYVNKLSIEADEASPTGHLIKMDVMIYTKQPIKSK